jgi:nucleotide-binding universal stress UspA family protein
MRRILVALDGSADSEAVLEHLYQLFRFVDCEVHLARVTDGSPAQVRAARGQLDTVLAKARARRAVARVVTLHGPAAAALLMHAVTGSFDLIAIAAQERLADELMRKSPFPVFFVRPDAPVQEVREILVPLDGSRRALRALSVGAMLARTADGRLTLMTAVPEGKPVRSAMTRLEKIRLDLAGPSRSVVEFGDPERAILERSDAQLVVMASHGRGGAGRRRVGRVTRAVLRGSRVPLVVVRTGGLSERELEPRLEDS